MQRTGGGPPHIWFWPPRPLPLPPLPHPRRGRDPEGQETSSCLRAPGWGSSFSRAPFLEFGLSLLTRPRRPPQAPHPPPLLHLHQQRLFVFFNFSAALCPVPLPLFSAQLWATCPREPCCCSPGPGALWGGQRRGPEPPNVPRACGGGGGAERGQRRLSYLGPGAAWSAAPELGGALAL